MTPELPPLALRDIHLPEGVSWWPPALGWWLLLTGALLAAILAIYYWRRFRRIPKPKRAALRQFQMLQAQYRRQPDPQQLVQGLSVLLRRVCLSYFPRVEVASLTGDQWLEFLGRHHGNTQFTRGVGKILVEAPYSQHCSFDSEALLKLCHEWIMALPSRATER